MTRRHAKRPGPSSPPTSAPPPPPAPAEAAKPDRPAAAGAIALILIMATGLAAGLVVRFSGLPRWNRLRAATYHEDTPILTTADAYLFTRYAREEAEGIYRVHKLDPMRNYPDGMPYPGYIPLICWLTALIHRLTGTSIEIIAFYLPVLLAPLFVIPLSLYGRQIGRPLAALAGGVLGATYSGYVARSTLGRFDTDCLNLFFLFLLAWLVNLMTERTGRQGLIFAALAGLSYLFFDWWYNHPGFFFPYIGAIILLAIVNLFRRGSVR